ncbi:hypothetical protein MKZ38_008896 [Zalerion maritima]|uniref:Uncharacterized protein n=1 Tax=Zalerion maritima TaxID=339359 RepID=A0AAD5RTZ4_9PEZI|nr:hypothetical protein MKZ38_008896 [Zalerion maritima]
MFASTPRSTARSNLELTALVRAATSKEVSTYLIPEGDDADDGHARNSEFAKIGFDIAHDASELAARRTRGTIRL